MMVNASLLQGVSTLHVVVTMLSVWQEHTVSVCNAYSAVAVDKMHIRLVLGVLPFAAAVDALQIVALSL